jgi:hypothetical protein
MIMQFCVIVMKSLTAATLDTFAVSELKSPIFTYPPHENEMLLHRLMASRYCTVLPHSIVQYLLHDGLRCAFVGHHAGNAACCPDIHADGKCYSRCKGVH